MQRVANFVSWNLQHKDGGKEGKGVLIITTCRFLVKTLCAKSPGARKATAAAARLRTLADDCADAVQPQSRAIQAHSKKEPQKPVNDAW